MIYGAKKAWSIFCAPGYPSLQDYKWAVQTHQVKDCQVTVQHIKNTDRIWGKDITVLEGKTTRQKAKHVAGDIMDIPREILQWHRRIILALNIFFVNTLPFLLTMSRKIFLRQCINYEYAPLFERMVELHGQCRY